MRRIVLTISIFLLVGGLNLNAQTSTMMPTQRKFYIQSAMNYGYNNGGYWDVPGKPGDIKKGSNIQVWNLDNGHDREFTLLRTADPGYYEIQIGNTYRSRIDIQGRNTANGTSVKTWDSNDQANQRFLFHHMGNGRFKIYDRNSGKIICLKGKKNDNGTNVHIWSDHSGPYTEWYLIDANTKKAYIPDSGNATSRPSQRVSTKGSTKKGAKR